MFLGEDKGRGGTSTLRRSFLGEALLPAAFFGVKMVKRSSRPEIVYDQCHRPSISKKRDFPSSKHMGSTEAGTSRSLDQSEIMSEEMDMDKLWKEIRCLGTSAMSWKERKKLEDKQVVNLGGKASKRQRLPLSVAKPMMKKQKKREQKQLEEGLLLGQFMTKSRGKKQDKRRAEDRVLMATEGHFKGGILNVKHLLKLNPQGSNEMPSAWGMHPGRKKGKDKGRGNKNGKGGGKKNGKGRRR